ncbi:hypothetical protein JCM8547_001650 [Rhodosporidiobolus lusitaniae]
MLDRLPTELVTYITQLAAPPDYTPSFYRERRAFLRTCCLVSKTLCQIAHPMLLEVLEVRDNGEESALGMVEEKLGGETRGNFVKLLALYGNHGREMGVESLSCIACDCPNMVEIRIFGHYELFLSNLAWALYLQRIVIFGGELYDPLIALLPSLSDISYPPEWFSSLKPTNVPSLRALGLSEHMPIGTLDRNDTFTSLPQATLDQLDVLSLYSEDRYKADKLALLPTGIIQVDCSLAKTLEADLRDVQSKLACLRLFLPPRSTEDRWKDDAASALRSLDELFRSSSLPFLRLVIFPYIFRTPSSSSDELRHLAASSARTFREKGVEVLFEPEVEWSSESTISSSFWRYRRKLRREKQQGGKAEMQNEV